MIFSEKSKIAVSNFQEPNLAAVFEISIFLKNFLDDGIEMGPRKQHQRLF